jgi:hypothetical protein
MLYDGVSAMDPTNLLELITIELKLARALLELAAPDVRDPSDPEGTDRVIHHARTALEGARTFMPKANLSMTERTYLEGELSYLEAAFQGLPAGQEKASRKKRK